MADDNPEAEYSGQPIHLVQAVLMELIEAEDVGKHERDIALMLLDVIYNFDKRLRALEKGEGDG